MRFIKLFPAAAILALPFATPITSYADTTGSSASGGTPSGTAQAPTTSSQGLFVTGDVVAGGVCLVQNQYNRGTMMVFRAQVLKQDGTTASDKTDVELHLANGQTIPMQFGPHRGPSFWTAVYVIPADAPIGMLPYFITAKDSTNGTSGTFVPLGIPPQVVAGLYTTNVTLTSTASDGKSMKSGDTISVSASVGSTSDGPDGKPVFTPLTDGTVTASFGQVGDVDSKGNLNTTQTVNLTYDSTAQAWTGTLTVPSSTATGTYEVLVSAADKVNPTPNAGTGSADIQVNNDQTVTITLNGNPVTTVPKLNDTYVPIWYLIHALNDIGVSTKWDGHTLTVIDPALTSPISDLGGSGSYHILINGQKVLNTTGIVGQDPWSHVKTTYFSMSTFEALVQGLGLTSNFDGYVWNITSQN